MIDTMSTFWHWFVVIPTILGLIGCFWLLQSNATGVAKDQAAAEEHVWDEDLSEYNNPLPKWWFNLFMITIVFGAGYLVLYPGLGNFKGLLNWSQIGQYTEEVADADADYGPLYKKYASIDIATLVKDPNAIKTGKRLFSTYCTTCHGSDARGAKGFPSLVDDEWLYGGEPDNIKKTLTDGRAGAMPAWGAAMDTDTLKAVVEYVQSLHTNQGDPKLLALGKEKYGLFCVACHGADGKGNPALGAPNLANDIWLYGGSDRLLLETLQNGRNGQMPAHGNFLGADKVHLLTAYVYSLSQTEK